MSNGIPIVDAHHHLWDLEKNDYPWLHDPPADHVIGDLLPLGRSYLIEDFLKDIEGHNVVKSVHIQADWNPDDPVGETRWLQGVADEHGLPSAFVVFAPLHEAEASRLIEQHLEYANVRGVRQMLLWHPDPKKTFFNSDLLRDHNWRRGFELLESYDLSFDLAVYETQMADAAEFLSKHPNTRVALLHGGMPIDRDPEGWERWRKGLSQLASCSNIWAKISGWGMVDNQWSVENLRRFTHEILEKFGPERSMLGSNFPVDGLYSTYAELIDAFREVTADLSESERHALYHETAEAFYRLQ